MSTASFTSSSSTHNPSSSAAPVSSSRTMSIRKPVPSLVNDPVVFPMDNSSPPEPTISFPSYRRLAKSGPSPAPSYLRTPSPPISRPIYRSPLISTGQFVLGSAPSSAPTQYSSSLTRNSSVPASLTHNTSSSSFNSPARSASASVSQSRPSLSSPSPPTPIVPYIPLRHATQRSPSQQLYLPGPSTTSPTPKLSSTAQMPLSRGSLDRPSSTKKPLTVYNPGIVTFANASDPNLPSWSTAPSTPVISVEPNYCTLPLKHLLAKPASPSLFQGGSESYPYYGNHLRSASTADSVQYAIARPNSDISAFEFPAVRTIQACSPVVAPSVGRVQNGPYHYRRTVDTDVKADRRFKIPGNEGIGRPKLKGDERSDLNKVGKDGAKGKSAEPRPRNVLRRRPSNLVKAEPRDLPSDSSRLSRSFSASSLFRRASIFTTRNLNVRVLSPSPKSSTDAPGSTSPVPLKAKADRANSHGNHNSAQQQHHQNSDMGEHTVTTQLYATKMIPINSSAPLPYSKKLSPKLILPVPSSLPSPSSSPAPARSRLTPDSRLSTISSGSSTDTHSLSRDKNLSPAGAVADAYKRERIVKEAAVSTTASPSQSLLHSNSIRSDPEVSPQLLHSTPSSPVVDTNGDSAENSQRSSTSALSYAGATTNKTDMDENTVNPTGATKEAGSEGIQQPLLLEPAGLLVTKEVSVRSFLTPSPQPSDMASSPTPCSTTSSPLVSPPFRTSSNETRSRNRLRKNRQSSDQGEFAHSPYYTVVGSRNDQVYGVGSPRDSYGAGYSSLEKSTWGIQTTITAGPTINEVDKDKISIGKSLSRKLSGKFKRPRSAGANDENTGPRRTWQDGRAPPFRSEQGHSRDKPEKSESDDRCLPYLYASKKHAHSEMDLSIRETEKESGGGGGGGGSGGNSGGGSSSGAAGGNGSRFPKIWRVFGRSKSRERNDMDMKTEAPPPLPTLPKHYVSHSNDSYTPIYSRNENRGQDLSPRTHKSPRSRSLSKSSPTTPSGRPSTATRSSTSEAPSTPFWNRTHSARSSVSSLLEVPPMPSPMPDFTRFVTDDTESRKGTKVSKASARSPRKMHGKAEEEYTNNNKSSTNLERSESPPIPMFSTAEPINSFPPRRSSERSKSSSTTSPTSTSSPTSPAPPRPARHPQRPKLTDSRTNSFSDEALYPPVMNQSSRSIPKMTFRQLDESELRRQALTEKEKSDKWAALLEKSDAAGGTLHFGGGEDKLPSDELRFSRTLSELGS